MLINQISLKPRRWQCLLGFSIACLFTLILIVGCTKQPESSASETLPVYSYEIVNQFPHKQGAFTQGLLFKDGFLYESTGLKGHSTVRRVSLDTGDVLQAARIDEDYYAEGLAAFGDDLILLTWQAGTGLIINRDDFTLKSKFSYEGEGWGLTNSSSRLFMSDGTSYIRVLDPKTLQETSRFEVTERGEPVDKLNELEWVEGELYANVWKSDRIAKINPGSGEVTGWIDLTGVFEKRNPKFQGEDVLNGIAYDALSKRLFVTGKLWPYVFEIEVVE